jgi:hypothetical protein
MNCRTPEVPGYARFLNLTLFLAQETSLGPWKYAAIREYEQFALDFMQGPLWPNLLVRKYTQAFVTILIPAIFPRNHRARLRPAGMARRHGLGYQVCLIRLCAHTLHCSALRSEITTLACRLHLSDCMHRAQMLFRSQLLEGCKEVTVPYCSK